MWNEWGRKDWKKVSVAGKTTGLRRWHWEGCGSAPLPWRRCFSHRTPGTSHVWAGCMGSRAPVRLPQDGRQAEWSQQRGPPNQQVVLAVCMLLVTVVREVLFPRGENCKNRTCNKERKAYLELKSDGTIGLCSDLDACCCWGCLAWGPSTPLRLAACMPRPTGQLQYVAAASPWLRMPGKSCEKIRRRIGKANTSQTEAGLLKDNNQEEKQHHKKGVQH